MATNITITEMQTPTNSKNRIITITSNDNITTMERRTGRSGETTMCKYRLLNYSINDNGIHYVDSNTTINANSCYVDLNGEHHLCPGGVKLMLYGKDNIEQKEPFVDIYLFY